MNLEGYTEELITHMKAAIDRYRKVKDEINATELTAFIHVDGETLFNSKYIKVYEYYQICELEKFLQKHADLNSSDLHLILNRNAMYFYFLSKLENVVPDLINTIKEKGSKHTAEIYVNNLIYPTKEQNL